MAPPQSSPSATPPHPGGYPAVYMRGGTSKGVFFHERDLPTEAADRERLFLSIFGSPDRFGRQLNGMGGGISSTSKAIIVRRSTYPDAEVDFLHGQVSVDRPVVDWSANCGNLSAAVGPFALAEGLIDVAASAIEAVVRLRNLNTGALIVSRFPVADGAYSEAGGFQMPGVSGTGGRIALEYLSPGDPRSGVLFPSGRPLERASIFGREVRFTAAYATLPVAWVLAEDVGLEATLPPDAIDANREAMALLDGIRREAAVRMGLAATAANAHVATPKIGIVGPPQPYGTLSGEQVEAADVDILARVISMERAHKAMPLTAAMCLAAACLAEGGAPARVCAARAGRDIRIGAPSGVLTAGAVLKTGGGLFEPDRTITYATARRLMAGWVYGSA